MGNINYKQETEQIFTQLVEVRRDFHKYPEYGWTEYRTSALIAKKLEAWGWQVHVGKEVCRAEDRMGLPSADELRAAEQRAIDEGADERWIELMRGGQTGVVGVLKGNKPGPVIAYRMDIDSNVLEESEAEDHRPVAEGFRSVHRGMMHACGHDGHASIGLGLAQLLSKHRDEIHGEIRILFQPAEEGCRGAKSMVAAGWLDGVDYFYSGHIAFKSFEVGEVATSNSSFLATTKLNVEYKGKPAHAGAAPEEGRNALLAAAAATMHLHSISRHGGGATRINVGRLDAGGGRNVIADYAKMKLETRGETSELNEYMKNEAIRMIEQTAQIYDVQCKWEIVGESIDCRSDIELCEFVKEVAGEMEQVHSIVKEVPFGGSEDATYMMDAVQKQGGKATYMLFGSPIPEGHHQSKFDFDEQALAIGVELLFRLALSTPHTLK